MCKVLTSQKFCHINPPVNPPPQDDIEMMSDQLCEGESGDGMPSMGITGHDEPTHNC